VPRIAAVIPVRQAAVRLHRRGVGQVHDVACLMQAIHQPIPVEGGLNDNALQLGVMRLQHHQHIGEHIGHAPLGAHPVSFVDHTDHAVVRMKINSCLLHLGLLWLLTLA